MGGGIDLISDFTRFSSCCEARDYRMGGGPAGGLQEVPPTPALVQGRKDGAWPRGGAAEEKGGQPGNGYHQLFSVHTMRPHAWQEFVSGGRWGAVYGNMVSFQQRQL